MYSIYDFFFFISETVGEFKSYLLIHSYIEVKACEYFIVNSD